MNILILGSGGREHALTWKLAQSKKVKKIFIGPGNAGTFNLGTNLDIDPCDFPEVKKAVLENKIDIVIVGPEAPLVKGIHDFFLNDSALKNISVIGPDKSAARLEGSKDFAKAFLIRHKIPTAAYKSFDKSTFKDAAGFLKTLKPPYVIKADGLASGKGVLIIDDINEAEREIEAILHGKFGPAGDKVVIEEFLKGIELSVFIITDGISYKLLPEAKDYKRIGEGDTGLNTGGMGAVSPVSFADNKFMQKVKDQIIDPTMKGLSEEGIIYKGFIFFGLINVEGDPFVIEYNARLGDPESEAIIPRIKSDFFDLIEGVAKGNLAEKTIGTDDRFVTSVMLVSGGYPGDYETGKQIHGLNRISESIVFHAGTKITKSEVVTSGGRVLAVSSWGNTMKKALEISYRNADLIKYEGIYYRKDIGMFLRLFKGTAPGVIVLIIILLLAVWTNAFLNPQFNSVSIYETEPMPLYGLLKFVIGNHPFIGVVFSFSMVCLIAFLLVNFNTNVFFINERTFLPALIYIIFGGFFPQFQLLNPALPASLFLLMAIIRIMEGYRKPGIAYNFFDGGILISIGTLFYANLIWFGLLVIIGIALLRTGNLLEIAVSVLGLLTPLLLAFGIYFVYGKDLSYLFTLIENNLLNRSEGYPFPRLTIVALIFSGLIILVSVFHMFMYLNTKKIKSRKTFSLLIWTFLIALGVYFALPSVSVEIWWIISIPVSYFLSHYFIFIKKKIVPEVLFSVLFLLILLIQIWYLK
jgi:phosphoribosylamine--glycine ligase